MRNSLHKHKLVTIMWEVFFPFFVVQDFSTSSPYFVQRYSSLFAALSCAGVWLTTQRAVPVLGIHILQMCNGPERLFWCQNSQYINRKSVISSQLSSSENSFILSSWPPPFMLSAHKVNKSFHIFMSFAITQYNKHSIHYCAVTVVAVCHLLQLLSGIKGRQ